MTKPAATQVVTEVRPQVAPSIKQKLLTTGTVYGRCLISDPLEPGEIIDLPYRCLITDPPEQGEIIDLTVNNIISDCPNPGVGLTPNNVNSVTESDGETSHSLSFLQTSTVRMGNEGLEEGEIPNIDDDLNSQNNDDSNNNLPQSPRLSTPHLALSDLHHGKQPPTGPASTDIHQLQEEESLLGGTTIQGNDIINEGMGLISYNIAVNEKSTASTLNGTAISTINSKGDPQSPNRRFKSPNLASPNGSVTPKSKRKNSKNKLPPVSPSQPKIKSSLEARSRSVLRSEELLRSRSASLKRPSPSPGKDNKAAKISKVGEDKASTKHSKLSFKT